MSPPAGGEDHEGKNGDHVGSLDVEAEVRGVAVAHHVVLAFDGSFADERQAASEPSFTESSHQMISALMKPRSKSVWIVPAACGARCP